MKLAILGASTPFTCAFLLALAAKPWANTLHIVLYGRDSKLLEQVSLFSQKWLPNTDTSWTCTLSEALSDATVVVNQIRYGGLEGRAEAERIAADLRCPSDETLGPAALYTILRSAKPLHSLATALAKQAPAAWILNLTNPLSLSTAILANYHSKVIGICELPHTTAASAERFLGRRLDWRCVGLNHRSFLLFDAVSAINQPIAGVRPEWIQELNALPTKYHRLLRCPPPCGPSRAAELKKIKCRSIQELRENPRRIPPSLSERVTDWYSDGVVPLLEALQQPIAQRRVVNRLRPSGIVEEGLAEVLHDSVRWLDVGTVPAPLQTWLQRYHQHEHALLEAVSAPSSETICEALRTDPLIQACNAVNHAKKLIPLFLEST